MFVFLVSFSTFYNFSDICAGQSDGYTLPYLGCRAFWLCMNALPVPMCCPSGQIFSGVPGGNCVVDVNNVCTNVVCSPNWVLPTAGMSKLIITIIKLKVYTLWFLERQ